MIDIQQLSPSIGAELHGVTLAPDMSEANVAAIRAALLTHKVVFFRDQTLSAGELVETARRFGELSVYPFVAGMEGHPEIVEVIKREDETTNFGGLWHSDTTYLERPPLGSLLYARELPPLGGDTLFANMVMAWESLSPGLQRLLINRRAIYSAEKPDAAVTRQDRIRERGVNSNVVTTSVHPVVRTHPETGQKALYVNGGHTVNFEGMTPAESKPVLEHLYRVQQRPEFSCRFSWTPGAVAFWDNRSAQHNALNDYHGHRRVMWRVTLAGDIPS